MDKPSAGKKKKGLPAIVTIVLSIGGQRMVNKNAIIRKLPAVEPLGGQTLAFMVLAL